MIERAPCRCSVCLALLELAASADRTLRAQRVGRKLRVMQGGKKTRDAA